MKKLAFSAVLSMAVMACAPTVPPGPVGGSVAGTSWRVVAVNGRQTPRTGEFYMNFEQARFGAKFGCNGMGADYVQRGNVIDAGPVVGTQMACPDMSYETQAHVILEQDMIATWNGPGALRLVNRGGSIDLKR